MYSLMDTNVAVADVAVTVVVHSCYVGSILGINNDQPTKTSDDSWLLVIDEMVPCLGKDRVDDSFCSFSFFLD